MTNYGGLVTQSEGRLTENQAEMLTHVSMFGSSAYPLRKCGRQWVWGPMFGISGPPALFKTKTAAAASFEVYLSVLRDKLAGRGDWA